MPYDPIALEITTLENTATAEEYDRQLGSIIKRYGVDFATSVMNRYVQKRLMASGHQVSLQEIIDYVKKIAGGLNSAYRK
jgi:hypothetical protein|tara:strand:+ start:656 stop:895 length:240 start_codon:yes stop_codon:yes gene_type:complete